VIPRTGSSVPLDGVALATNSIVLFCAAACGPTAKIAEIRKHEVQIPIFMMFIVAEWQASRYKMVGKVNVSPKFLLNCSGRKQFQRNNTPAGETQEGRNSVKVESYFYSLPDCSGFSVRA
jgi:hypothetical protein